MEKEGKPGNIPCSTALKTQAKAHPLFACPKCLKALKNCPICRAPLNQ